MRRQSVAVTIAAGAAALAIGFLSIQRGAPGSDVTRVPDSAEELASTHETPQVDFVIREPIVEAVADPRTDPGEALDRRTLSHTGSRPTAPPVLFVRGRVVDPSGNGVPDATVFLSKAMATTESDGDFELALRSALAGANAESRVLALKPGYQLGVFAPPIEKEPVTGVDVPLFPPFVVVTLGPPALSIEGTVVDDDDRPVPRARVWIADPTPLHRATTEEATAHFFENLCADSNWSMKMTPVSWVPVDADADGRFELEGLLARTYRVEAFDRATLAHSGSIEIAAGTRGARVKLKTHDLLPRVSGRVQDALGLPIRGARVQVQRIVQRGHGITRVSGARVTTDEAGQFELADVPPTGVSLQVEALEIEPTEYAFGSETGETTEARLLNDLVITVERHVPIQVLATTNRRANGFKVVDANGEPLQIWEKAPGMTGRGESGQIVEELYQPRIYWVRPAAHTVVFYENRTELDRRLIEFDPSGAVTIVNG